MKLIKAFAMNFFIISVIGLHSPTYVYAVPDKAFQKGKEERVISLEHFYLEHGYTSIENAVSEFSTKYNKKIRIPKELPFVVTQQFGKVEENGSKLELDIQNNITHDLLKIHVFEDEKTILRKPKAKQVYLNDGTEALIRTDRPFVHLQFKKNGLTYLMGITKRSIKNEEEMIKIASNAFLCPDKKSCVMELGSW